MLQLQQQLNQIKAQRAKQAADAAADASPYHETAVRSGHAVAWRAASHSPEKRRASYYQQVRAKLMAEKKAQEQRRQKIYLAHLASIYGMAPGSHPPPSTATPPLGPSKRKPSQGAASIRPLPAKERAEWQQVIESRLCAKESRRVTSRYPTFQSPPQHTLTEDNVGRCRRRGARRCRKIR